MSKLWYLCIKYLPYGERVPCYKRVANYSTSALTLLECELTELRHDLDGKFDVLGIVLREDLSI